MATEIVEWAGGEVLFAGCTDYVRAGGRAGGQKGKKTPAEIKEDEARALQYPNLYAPTRFKALQGIKVKWIASGAAACHSLIGDAEGRCWTWGRNEKGQLGHGDLCQRNVPMVVEALKGLTISAGAAGKHHSVVVTSTGDSWAFGLNSTGQLGTGSVKNKGKIEGADSSHLHYSSVVSISSMTAFKY